MIKFRRVQQEHAQADNLMPFYQEGRGGGRYRTTSDEAGRDFVSRCVFHEGVHYAGVACPHKETSDEMGEIIADSWTVQQ